MNNPRKEIFNNLAYDWDKMNILDVKQINSINDVLDDSSIQNNDYILDVGCGTGILIPYLLDRISDEGKVIGIDVSERMIEIAKNKYNDNRLYFIVNDIFHYDFKDLSFNKIFVFSTFPHLDEKDKILNRFYKILNKDGLLIIFHLAGSSHINFFHKNKVQNSILKKDYLPCINELRNIIDDERWIEVSMVDKDDLYLIKLKKK